MANNEQTAKPALKLQKRDWAIILLVLAVIGTNWVWYQNWKYQDTTNKTDSTAWLQQQYQIDKMHECINAGTKPCDIMPPKHYYTN